MKNRAPALPTELHQKIQSIALGFAEEVLAIFEHALTNVAVSFAPGKTGVRAAAPVVAERKRAGRGAGPGRPRTDSSQLKNSILLLLRKNKEGMGAEQINRALETTSRDLARPIQELLAEGRVRRTGMARGTKYIAK